MTPTPSLKALHAGLLAGACLLPLACTSSSTTGNPEERQSVTLGAPVGNTACSRDADCPVGYRCVSPQCVPVERDLDSDGYDAPADCDDQDPSVNPGAAEVCNNRDDNCSSVVDEGVRNACGDCGPVPDEVCDLMDNDCDGTVDDGCIIGTVAEVEPNNGQSACQEIALPFNVGDTATITGAWDPAGDMDSFCFTPRARYKFLFDVDSQVLGAPSDSVIAVYDAATGTRLPGGFNDYAMGPDPRLEYAFTSAQRVRLDIYNFDALRGGPSYIYQLKVTLLEIPDCPDADRDGLTPCDGDCDDDNVLVFPGQTEVCDGADNNCDGTVDDGCPDLTRREAEPNDTAATCEFITAPFTVAGVIDERTDRDWFCFFLPRGARVGMDVDAREPPFGSLLDSRLRLYRLPYTTSTAYEAQNDDGTDPDTGYMAVDSDSYLAFDVTRPAVYALEVAPASNAGGARHTYTLRVDILQAPPCTDMDGDGVSACEGDCDDGNPAVHYGALEVCDLQDNNCDGAGDPEGCDGDFDGDSVTGLQGDCDNADPTVSPDATEVCDGLDNDCDGLVDEDVRNACGTCGFAPPERCGNGVDDDCDGVTDTDCSSDTDSDGVTPDQGDCNDTDPAVKPSATETCNNKDDDCDGLIDEFVKNACGECAAERPEVCDGADNNCNGIADEGVLNLCGRCGPAPEEVCDGADNNCNGQVDEGLLNTCGTCGALPREVCDLQDNDCDLLVDEGCDVDSDNDLVTPRAGDCADDDNSVAWGKTEVCGDGKDNDCNGRVDDTSVCGPRGETEPNNTRGTCQRLAWPVDVAGTIPAASDVDVYCIDVPAGVELGFDIDAIEAGSPLDTVLTLQSATGTTLATNAFGRDPDSGNSTADPALTRVFENAGTYVVQVGVDTGGGAGTNASYTLRIRKVAGCTDLDRDGVDTCNGDCNDFNASTHPAPVDTCDSVDNNCNGATDERCVGTCLDDLREPNDTASQANAAPRLGSGVVSGLQFCPADEDYYALDLLAGDAVNVSMTLSDAMAAPLLLRLLGPNGMELARSEAGTPETPSEAVSLPSATAGTHYVVVGTGFGGTAAAYELTVNVTPP